MAWFGFFISPPPSLMRTITLVLRKTVELESFQDPKDPRFADLDIVISTKIHRNLIRPKMISLPKIQKLGQDFGLRRSRAMFRTM
jgi:hypothetical protein